MTSAGEPDDVERTAKVLEYRAQGKTWAETAALLGVTVRTCHRLVAEEADRVRAEQKRLVSQRILEHDRKLEWLYERLAATIHEYATRTPPRVDEKLVRAAVSVLERQAKLLGLDAAKAPAGGGANDWMRDDTPLADVIRTAELYGIKIPDTFRTVGGV
jgi:cytosine/adenosine deaminase-related metal-dependent hydrolase